ncbi:MAG TPA: DNA polymerase III subunit beta [Candidatus Atribacteria bacterium]|nr:DNA polymerase III subunit beta [Candidatus Atribacteria bacterium]
MKLICTQNNFKKAIFNTERVIGKQNTLPILKNIMLKTEKGQLKFSATNLEIGIIAKIGAKIERKGEITIPARLLSDFVNNLPSEEKVLLETKNQTLIITSGNYNARINGLDAADFPIIPKLKSSYLVSLTAQKFKEAISKILFCVAINENRPEFSGVNVDFLEDKIILAATDSFRLAEINLKFSDNEIGDNYRDFITKKNTAIVPYNTFSEIARAINTETKKVDIAVEENQIFFEIDGVQVVSRLINGKYPDYKQIVPQKFSTRAVLAREDFLRAVKISNVFADSKSGEINLKIDSKKSGLIIQAQSHESGENKAKLKADIVGPSQEIVLNSRYIIDGASVISSFNIAILVNNESSPVGIKSINNKSGEILEDYIYIVMPIKK